MGLGGGGDVPLDSQVGDAPRGGDVGFAQGVGVAFVVEDAEREAFDPVLGHSLQTSRSINT